MGENSKIEWTDHTFNPWLGCTKVSRACQHCYAEGWAKRSGLVGWGPTSQRRRTSAANWKEPAKWNAAAAKIGARRRVFCASLADVFDDHESIQAEWRADLWKLIAETPDLEWLLLTKRPQHWPLYLPVAKPRDPFRNIRLGVTIEDQGAFDERWPVLQLAADLGWPTFVSYEPATGPVDWSPAFKGKAIGWLISGGESGHDAKPSHPDWHRAARDLCQQHQVPYLFKQWGEYLPFGQDLPGFGRIHGCVGVRPGWHRLYANGSPVREPDIAYKEKGVELRGFGDGELTFRVGKKAAGRLLDGREWSEFPP